jgi:ABC-type antimicrobial peptide transport system permease subunit
MLSGRPIRNRQEIVLGASTLADLHKKVGDSVTVTNSEAHTHLRIVGTATMPAVGVGHGLHLSMGSGAWVSWLLLPAPARNITQNASPGANIMLINYRPTVSAAASSKDMARVAGVLTSYNPNHVDPAELPDVSPLSVQRPAEIVNYRAMGAAPVILGVGLAVGASLALAAALAASVRRRRRELALLKSLGFTRGQLRATVAWQSSVVVLLGTIVGVPLGIAFGRLLWNAFADELHVIADPTVPTQWIVAIALGALVLANLVAAMPGRSAGRTPTALVLREE